MGSFQPWANPDPQSVAGLNSAMVYGENLQFTTGMNHQVALGSNLQLCINPAVLFDLLNLPGSATLAGLWGTGLGGNMQFTIGSNTTFTWGRQFDIHLGPEKIEVNANEHKAFTMAMCALIGSASIAYSIGYGICGDEDGRATLAIGFQLIIDLLLGALMTQMMYYKSLDISVTGALTQLFQAPASDHSTALEDFAGALSAVALLGAAVAPAVAIAVEEGHFQGHQQDSSS
jgi:hypothetical protein